MSKDKGEVRVDLLAGLLGFISVAWLVFVAWAIYTIVTWITSK